MRVLAATVRLDVRLQARSRLYALGIGTAVVLGLVARSLFGPDQAGSVLPALYLLGIGSTTYVFGAALVLMERSQGTLAALRASGMSTLLYLGSKVLTLTAFALLEALVVYAVGFWGVAVAPAPLLLGVVTLGGVYTLVGMGQVAAHDSVTSFLMPGALIVGSLLQLPFLYILGVGPPGLWYAVPTQGPTLFMLAGFAPLTAAQWAYALLMSAAAVGAAAWWARMRFARFVGFGGDRRP